MQLKAAVARARYSSVTTHHTTLATPVSTVWLHLEESLVRVLVLPGQEITVVPLYRVQSQSGCVV